MMMMMTVRRMRHTVCTAADERGEREREMSEWCREQRRKKKKKGERGERREGEWMWNVDRSKIAYYAYCTQACSLYAYNK